jgi:sugar phosphate isomerase/epimerase
MNIEEAKVNQAILTFGSKIKHVHLADNHRFQPGDGHIDFVSGFKALKSVGYDGGFAFECRVLGDNPLEEYKKSLEFIKASLKEAGY